MRNLLQKFSELGWLLLFLSLIYWGAESFAHAGEMCIPLDKAQAKAKAMGGVWSLVSPPQWQFLRGIWAMDPITPPGLPLGDSAMLMKEPGHPDAAMVFFLDGDLVCAPGMPVPKKLLDMLSDIKSGKIYHEGKGL